jgi:hypothetical protein
MPIPLSQPGNKVLICTKTSWGFMYILNKLLTIFKRTPEEYTTSTHAKELETWNTKHHSRIRYYVWGISETDYIAVALKSTPVHWNYINLDPSLQAECISHEHVYLLTLLHKLNVRPPL